MGITAVPHLRLSVDLFERADDLIRDIEQAFKEAVAQLPARLKKALNVRSREVEHCSHFFVFCFACAQSEYLFCKNKS
jgi:hypothetical protein